MSRALINFKMGGGVIKTLPLADFKTTSIQLESKIESDLYRLKDRYIRGKGQHAHYEAWANLNRLHQMYLFGWYTITVEGDKEDGQ